MVLNGAGCAAANVSERLVGAEEKACSPAAGSGESSDLGAELLAGRPPGYLAI